MTPRTRSKSGTPTMMRWDLTVVYIILSLEICLMQTDEYPSTCTATTVPKVPWPICSRRFLTNPLSNTSMCFFTIGAATSSWDYAWPSISFSYFASLRQDLSYYFLAEYNFHRFHGRVTSSQLQHPDSSSARSKYCYFLSTRSANLLTSCVNRTFVSSIKNNLQRPSLRRASSCWYGPRHGRCHTELPQAIYSVWYFRF